MDPSGIAEMPNRSHSTPETQCKYGFSEHGATQEQACLAALGLQATAQCSSLFDQE